MHAYKFSGLSFYSFSDLFTAVIDLPLGLLPVQPFLRSKDHGAVFQPENFT